MHISLSDAFGTAVFVAGCAAEYQAALLLVQGEEW